MVQIIFIVVYSWRKLQEVDSFLGPRGPLVPPLSVGGWVGAKNMDQLYSFINHHRTTNLSDIVWCMSDGVWSMSGAAWWKGHKTNIYSIILGMLACKSEHIFLHLKRLQSVEIILFWLLVQNQTPVSSAVHNWSECHWRSITIVKRKKKLPLAAVRLERRLCVRVNFIIDACTKRELLKHFGQLFRFTAMQWVRRVIRVLKLSRGCPTHF